MFVRGVFVRWMLILTRRTLVREIKFKFPRRDVNSDSVNMRPRGKIRGFFVGGCRFRLGEHAPAWQIFNFLVGERVSGVANTRPRVEVRLRVLGF